MEQVLKHLLGQVHSAITWAEISDPTFGLENEELILRNTYINALLLSALGVKQTESKKKKTVSVKWVDNKPENKQDIATVIVDKQHTPGNVEHVTAHRTIPQRSLKPIIRSIPQSN